MNDVKFGGRSCQSLLGSTYDYGHVAIWDAATLKLRHQFSGVHVAPAMGLAFSPINDILMASVGLDRKLALLDPSSAKSASFPVGFKLLVYDICVYNCAFSIGRWRMWSWIPLWPVWTFTEMGSSWGSEIRTERSLCLTWGTSGIPSPRGGLCQKLIRPNLSMGFSSFRQDPRSQVRHASPKALYAHPKRC